MAFPTGWVRKAKITIPDAQISGNNSNFPILITQDNLPAEMLDDGANSALNGGGDVRFSEDSAGITRLDIDVITFVTGMAPDVEIWVKLPTLNTGAAKDVYVWYQKAGETQPAVTAAFGRNAVYAGLKRTFSMAEDPADAAPQFIDRTGAGANGTANNTTYLSSVAEGLNFNNTNATTHGYIATNPTGSIAAGAVILDFKPTDVAVDTQYFIANQTGGAGSDRIMIRTSSSAAQIRLGSGSFSTRATLTDNVRTAIAMRWASGSATYHVDGVNSGSGYSYSSTPGSVSSDFRIGTYDGVGSFSTKGFKGDFYGLWLFDTDPGQDYINTFTGMLSDPATFADAGTPKAVGGGGSTLAIQTVNHSVSSDNAIFAQSHNLTINSVDQGHTAESLSPTQNQILVVMGGQHGQISDSLTQLQSHALIISDGRDTLGSDEILLGQIQALVNQNATHGISSVMAGLFDPTTFSPNLSRTHKAARANRAFSPEADDRTTLPTNNRTLRI